MSFRLSPSQLGMFTRCPEQWRRRYLMGEKIPPGIALIQGSAVHKACEVNFVQKIDSRVDEPRDVFEDAAATEYDARLQEDGIFMSKEDSFSAERLIGEGKDLAVKMGGALLDEYAPSIQPVLVEHKFEFLRDDIMWNGFIDVYDDNGIPRDLKTAAKKWSAGKAEDELQPTIYSKAVEIETGKKPDKFIFDVMTKTKEPKYQRVETTRDNSDFVVLDSKVETMRKMIKAGNFPPADPGGWVCSPKFCGWYLVCKYISDRNKKIYLMGNTKGSK